jgi:hypothetical protein
MYKLFPDVVVLRGRTTASKDFHFEVYDFADGSLVLTEPSSRVAAWLKAAGYRWILGSSGIWKREARRQPQTSPAPARPNTLLGYPRPAAPSGISSPGNLWLTESGAWHPKMPEPVSVLGRVKQNGYAA